MVKVESYLKVGDSFVAVKDFDGQVSDPDYIEGAIVLDVNDVEVLSREMWDYVDQFWAYIATGLLEITTTTEYATTLPDQPTKLIFRTDERRQWISVEANPSKGRVVASTSYDEFMTAMCEAGRQFFRKMIELVPENSAPYEAALQDLENAIPHAKQ